jgi:hypothetical protein
MKFDEFCKKLGFKRSETTAIGALFNQSPQTANNWRLRDKVPAEYVLEARDRKLFKRQPKSAA